MIFEFAGGGDWANVLPGKLDRVLELLPALPLARWVDHPSAPASFHASEEAVAFIFHGSDTELFIREIGAGAIPSSLDEFVTWEALRNDE